LIALDFRWNISFIDIWLVQIKAVAQLQSITSELTNYYIQLPQLSTIAVNSFHSTTIPPNNATTTITSGSGSGQGRNNYNASDYIENPDSCDCRWEEYQV
jgi:hypothetical protein